jgi:adenylyltransferase/sulfurtransferase
MGVLPGIIGSIQATEALKIVLDVGETLVGRLLLFDALRMRFREMRLRRDPACPACGEHPTIHEPIDYERFCGVGDAEADREDGMHDDVPEMTPTELKARLDRGDRVTIVDVREPWEWEIGNLEPQGARLVPLNDLPSRMDELNPEDELVMQCRSGARSAHAAGFLREQGFERVHNLAGGILRWSDEVDPSVPKY